MSEEATNQASPGGGSMRTKLLVGLLAILLVALAYDYGVARPSVVAAYDKIAARSVEVNKKSTEIFTNLDVREIVGKQPSRVFQDESGDTVEVFSWQRGVPFKTHDLFTVYKPQDGDLMFFRHHSFVYESSGEVTKNVSVTTSVEPVEEEFQDDDGQFGDGGFAGGSSDPADSNVERAMAEAGGGGRGGRGGGRRRGGFDPEAIFAENDEDGDGIWTGDEIPDRAMENLAEIDTDGDEAVSKEEWMARMRERFGGGRPRDGGGEGRPRGRARPEFDDDSEAPSDDRSEDDSDDGNAADSESAAEESADEESTTESTADESSSE